MMANRRTENSHVLYVVKWILGTVTGIIIAVSATYVSIVLGLLPWPEPVPTPAPTPTEIVAVAMEPAPTATATYTQVPSPTLTETPTNTPEPSTISVQRQNTALSPQLCGEDAFSTGTFETSTPRFVRPDGYGPGWITSDPLEVVMPDGTIEQIGIRHVLIVQDISILQLQNVHVGNIWGCWLREDRSGSIFDEAAYEYRRMKDGAPSEETGIFQITSDKLERVTVDENGLPVVATNTADAAVNCFNEAVRADGTVVGNQLEDNGNGVRLILMIKTHCFAFPLVVNVLSPGTITWQGHTEISDKAFQVDAPLGESMQIDATITCGPEFCSKLPVSEQQVTIQVGEYQLSTGPAFN